MIIFPVVEKLAKSGSYIDLPYTVKGMDFSFSGLLSASLRAYQKGKDIEDICFSLQETAFSMLVEVTERALSHTERDEVLLCGGVAANKHLREMLDEMVNQHYGQFYMPEMKYCGDNGAMIGWLGLLMSKYYGTMDIKDTNIIQKYRTDEVDIPWVKDIPSKIQLPKSYRIKEIDSKIIKSRTKSEAKILSDVKKSGIITPIIYDVDLDKKEIVMEYINGETVKNLIDNLDNHRRKDVSYQIGEYLSKIHNMDIIHGDLTSSNILIDKNNQLVFIDFGLSYYSNLIEDKADDLLVLKKSIKSVDYKKSKEVFNWILDSYGKNTLKSDNIIDKIGEIESRGRYTH